MTFTGTPDPINSKLLALSGTATGAGIVIYDNLHSKEVELGTATDGRGLNDGDNSLKFAAYLQGSSASSTVVPGDFTSVANFTPLTCNTPGDVSGHPRFIACRGYRQGTGKDRETPV